MYRDRQNDDVIGSHGRWRWGAHHRVRPAMRIWRPDETLNLSNYGRSPRHRKLLRNCSDPARPLPVRRSDCATRAGCRVMSSSISKSTRRSGGNRGASRTATVHQGFGTPCLEIGPHHPDAAVLDPRARYRPLSLAARQRQRSCNRVLRRCGNAEQVLLRAPPMGRV